MADAQGFELESIRVDPHRFDEATLVEYMKESGNVPPSMLQDLDAGRATEVDVVSGGEASRARAPRADPVQRRVVELVHSMERGERSPDPRWLAHVSEAHTMSVTDGCILAVASPPAAGSARSRSCGACRGSACS